MRSVRSSAVAENQTALRTYLLVALSLASPIWVPDAAAVENDELLIEEGFESGLSRWQLDNADSIAIVPEPGTPGNHVLRLTPEENTFTHAILVESEGWSDLRIEGRFLFPTDGDGYLGFIYNYQESIGAEGVDRMDFGCIYVKSNGSYVKVSPHHDGNPSWRLYEEYRFDLEGDIVGPFPSGEHASLAPPRAARWWPVCRSDQTPKGPLADPSAVPAYA